MKILVETIVIKLMSLVLEAALPKHLSSASKSQLKSALGHLTSLPLKELRKKQKLVTQQLADIHKSSDGDWPPSKGSERDRAVANLQIMEKLLATAIDKQQFGENAIVSEQDAKFIKAANEFLKRVQKMSDTHMAKEFPNYPHPNPKYHFMKGRKYWRVVREEGGSASKSAYAFLDTTTGDVLKAAGWKAPARHARGNVFDSDFGMKAVGPYGARYLR